MSVGLLYTKKPDESIIEIFLEASQERGYLGSPEINSLEKAREKIFEIERLFNDSENSLNSFLKIFYGNRLVGFSITKEHTPAFRKSDYPSSLRNKQDYILLETKNPLLIEKTWHRLGFFFIKEKYRGKGLGQEVLKRFIVDKKYVWYQCDKNNIASKKVAQSCLKNYGLQKYEKPPEGYYYTFAV